MSKCKKHLPILSILGFLRHISLQKIFLYKKMVYTDYIGLRDCENAAIDKGIECKVYNDDGDDGVHDRDILAYWHWF